MPLRAATARLLVVEARSESPATGVVVVASVGSWSRTARTGLDGRVELEVPTSGVVDFDVRGSGARGRGLWSPARPGEVREETILLVPCNGVLRGVDHAGRVELDDSLVPGPLRIELSEDYRGAADVLERVARRRGVKATRCAPVAVELQAGESSEVVLRIVDAP